MLLLRPRYPKYNILFIFIVLYAGCPQDTPNNYSENKKILLF